MKKFLSIILCLIISLCPLALTGCGNRAEILKIYNAGEYMDEDVLAGFSQWYAEQTGGKKVTVQYKTYSTPEDVYTEVYKKKADYDLVCVSDYIISRLIRSDLLLPLNREVIYDGVAEEDKLQSRVLGFVNDYENYDTDPSYTADTRYSVPYMWGTLGIMYRSDLVVDGEGDPLFDWQNLTWDCLFKAGAYENYRYMKNSIRDAYASASVVANTQALSDASNGFTNYGDEYQALLKTVINDTSAQNLRAVEQTLEHQKKYLFAYESDDGKDDMITSAPSGYYGLFWSCDAGYAMEDSTDLYYGVPVEGSNVWVDSFAMPRYSANREAAEMFLKYICQYDNAYLNRDYAGCSSPLQQISDDTREVMQTAWDVVRGLVEIETVDEEILEDVEYYVEFFESSSGEDFGDMYIDLLFPTDEVLARCAVMKDSPKQACIDMAKMWIRVKS
ncbi:MAG: extracellular solute-binding protein [Clostridia bacterium]|nr:extracellular solute-binding protein [Clostridia bacterium]